MISVSYNTNQSAICCVVYHNKEFLDISISNLQEDTPREDVVRKATRASVDLYRKHGDGMDIRFRYPGILKGDRQENMVRECVPDENAISETLRKPFSINGVIASMVRKDNLLYTSYNDLSQPIYMYTDASVTDNRETAVSCCLITEDNQLLLLGSVEIPEKNVAIAESLGGILGFDILNNMPMKVSTKWFCDNQNVVDFYNGNRNRSKLVGSGLEDYFDRKYEETGNVEPNPISGSDNILADAMAKELRHKEMKSSVSYISPAIEDSIDHDDLEESRNRMIEILT